MTPTLHIPAEPRQWEAALRGLVETNRAQIRAGAIPRLYGSGVRYQAERRGREDWLPASEVLAQGHGDCEDLAAWRAAELAELDGVPARVELIKTGPALYHAITRYEVNGQTLTDDPSLRLGMKGAIDPTVLRLETGGAMRAIKISGVAPEGWAAPLVTRDGLLHVAPAEGHRVMIDQVSPGVYLVGVMEDDDQVAGIGAVLSTAALATTALKALLARAGARVIERNADGEGVLAQVREKVAERRAAREQPQDISSQRRRVFRLPVPVKVGCSGGSCGSCACGR